MKHWFLIVCGILAGCSNLDQDMVPGGNILDTAPKSNTELRHPEWGYPSASNVASSPRSYQTARASVKKSQNVTSLEMFLSRHNIPHETLSGGHLMIRLKEQVHFQTGSARLSAQSQDWIRNIGHYLAGRTDVDVVIDGHADSTGAESFNDTLSEKRAREVEKQLLATSIPRQRVFSRGFGEYVPKCSNATASGKACNRRVELTLIVDE
ncbi:MULTISPECIES: OmpA family protein [unclassified Vibrio]|uniref:OmpA family protein n=1 Tax=unclassified Vibrio TaxID=2614977 RepID=UPI001482065F|nr:MULTISPECIES: OmpA family protein [unclassified Vibrio]ELA7570702.1 OmpA family protein [Vibrio alginolyticus]MDW1809701.1 OmpA family protein [Vibrio sp. Vb2362]NNN39363.1 OmpA family protein [Vibrio sp. 2-2(2)]NNO02982.1 OmpA family protein [Vibrio sp. 7-5(1-a)]